MKKLLASVALALSALLPVLPAHAVSITDCP